LRSKRGILDYNGNPTLHRSWPISHSGFDIAGASQIGDQRQFLHAVQQIVAGRSKIKNLGPITNGQIAKEFVYPSAAESFYSNPQLYAEFLKLATTKTARKASNLGRDTKKNNTTINRELPLESGRSSDKRDPHEHVRPTTSSLPSGSTESSFDKRDPREHVRPTHSDMPSG